MPASRVQVSNILPRPALPEHMRLFCHGIGSYPEFPAAGLIAWAVMIGGSNPRDVHQPLSWDGVRGQWQTGHTSRSNDPLVSTGVGI